MRVPLEIETHDRKLGFDIAAVGNTLTSGTVISIPGGSKLEYQGTLVRKALDIPEVLKFIIDASVNVELALLATWLYEKVKSKKVDKIRVNRRVLTEITPEAIRQVLEEEFRLDE